MDTSNCRREFAAQNRVVSPGWHSNIRFLKTFFFKGDFFFKDINFSRRLQGLTSFRKPFWERRESLQMPSDPSCLLTASVSE